VTGKANIRPNEARGKLINLGAFAVPSVDCDSRDLLDPDPANTLRNPIARNLASNYHDPAQAERTRP
jgi:hypothetical protein